MRRFLLAAAVLLALVVPAGSAFARPIHAGRMGIGDSVMLDGKSGLLARGFVRVDAVVSRQFRQAPQVINYWRNKGLLPSVVVLHLGTNGAFTGAQCDAAVKAVGTRQIYLVTAKVPRRYRDPDNAILAACAKRHGNAHLIDWYGYSHAHTNWFAPDGYHLTSTGAYYYAKFIASHS